MGFIDAFVEEAFQAIGEQPPDQVFIRYEWRSDDLQIGRTWRDGDRVVLTTSRMPDEHELAHAVHLAAWPESMPFLQEGFAVLFDSRRIYEHDVPPTVDVLDAALNARTFEEVDYSHAWYIVSQIVFEHGVAGLRELWHATPPGTTAEEIKAAYEGLFMQPMEALFDPWIYAGELTDGEPIEVARLACDFSLCPAPVRPFDGEGRWSALGPSSCEADADAVGPTSDEPWFDPVQVWREYSLEHELGPYAIDIVPGQTDPPKAAFWPCYPQCSHPGEDRLPRYDDPPSGYIPLGTIGRYRVQVGTDLAALPVATAAELLLSR